MAQLNYKTLRQEVADEIRRKILKGEFKAGERIKEHEMAQLLGVSRGPVREALRQLEQEGLVRYERNVGCSVAPINEKDIYEIGLLRAALEILAVKLCKGTMEPQALQRMRDSVEQRVHAFIPQKSKAERIIVSLGLGITNHTDGAVFAPPRKRGKRSCQQFERLDRIGLFG